MGLGIIAQGIYQPGAPSKPGYALPEAKPEGASAEAKPAAAPLPVLLAKADVKKGEAATKVCSACHNFEEGAGAKVGPALYGVVDRDKGSVAGFDYSAGMKAKGGKWTFADLNEFLTKPSAYVSGTKMGYQGEENPEKRADIIVYLRSLSKSPAPLPAVTDADKAPAATPAKAEAPAAPAPDAKKPDAPKEAAAPPAAPPAPPAPPPPPPAPPAPPPAAAPPAPPPPPAPPVAAPAPNGPEPYKGADPQYPDAK